MIFFTRKEKKINRFKVNGPWYNLVIMILLLLFVASRHTLNKDKDLLFPRDEIYWWILDNYGGDNGYPLTKGCTNSLNVRKISMRAMTFIVGCALIHFYTSVLGKFLIKLPDVFMQYVKIRPSRMFHRAWHLVAL